MNNQTEFNAAERRFNDAEDKWNRAVRVEKDLIALLDLHRDAKETASDSEAWKGDWEDQLWRLHLAATRVRQLADAAEQARKEFNALVMEQAS
jgi:hypothetical protein